MKKSEFKEPQYNVLFDNETTYGRTKLGLMTNQVWQDDPRRLVFSLSRYKFVSKMIAGKNKVLEIGCGDAFQSRIVAKEVESLTVMDFDPLFIDDINERNTCPPFLKAVEHNLSKAPLPKEYDAIYALDVLEHIPEHEENRFLCNIIYSLNDNGVVILGMPSLESQPYASPPSKAGHVNCKSGEDFKQCMNQYFKHVFLFSMNDEVVHTGFYPMAHYLLALCVSPRTEKND